MPPDPLAVLGDRTTLSEGAHTMPLRVHDSSAPAARSFVRAVIGELVPAEHLEDVESCLAELVANALDAARRHSELLRLDWSPVDTPICVGVLTTDRWTRLDVRDPDPAMPEPKQRGLLETRGRGLVIVNALSDAYWHTPGSRHKTVHVLIPMPGVTLTTADHGAAGR